MDLLVYNYHTQVSYCRQQLHRVDCIFSWLTEVSQGIVKLTKISLGFSQGESEFHTMLLKSHFKLKFSQHISQDQILYHFLYQKDIFISQDVSHGKFSSHGLKHAVHMLFTGLVLVVHGILLSLLPPFRVHEP